MSCHLNRRRCLVSYTVYAGWSSVVADHYWYDLVQIFGRSSTGHYALGRVSNYAERKARARSNPSSPSSFGNCKQLGAPSTPTAAQKTKPSMDCAKPHGIYGERDSCPRFSERLNSYTVCSEWQKPKRKNLHLLHQNVFTVGRQWQGIVGGIDYCGSLAGFLPGICAAVLPC